MDEYMFLETQLFFFILYATKIIAPRFLDVHPVEAFRAQLMQKPI